jgi:DNA-directed RNA polymerase specialized sigma24 family protein
MNHQDYILKKFREGFDTVEIARRFGITEAEACRRLHAALAQEKKFPFLTSKTVTLFPLMGAK